MRALFFALLAMTIPASSGDRFLPLRPAEHSGMADASAAIAVSSNLFWAAGDEDNILRLYRSDTSGAPIKELDCSTFLKVDGKSPEADLEGAARLGNRAFWISSHGRNKDGKKRPNRFCLFATDIQGTGADVTLTPVGKPYRRLLEDLIGDSRFSQFRLVDAAKRAPKEAGALNIEGLSATHEGNLLIGFRSPTPGGQALLIPLVNPSEVIEGKSARFGPAIQLHLGGLGIRDIAFHDGIYIIIGGSGSSPCQLFRWAGVGTEPKPLMTLAGYTPEAIIIHPETGLRELHILSDDGNRVIGGIPSKDLADPRERKFRSFWVIP